MSCILITALYPLNSKYDILFYLKSLQKLWVYAEAPIVCFIPKELTELIKFDKHPDYPRILLCVEKCCWNAWDDLETKWDAENDHVDFQAKLFGKKIGKNITRDLVAVWQEKRHFVNRVIEAFPDFDKYLWCDAGVARKESMQEYLSGFPYFHNDVEGNNLCMQFLNAFESRHEKSSPKGIARMSDNSIGGSIMYGNKMAWEVFTKNCKEELSSLIKIWKEGDVKETLPTYASDEHLYYQVYHEKGGITLIPTEPVCYLGQLGLQGKWWGFIYLLSKHLPKHMVSFLTPIHYKVEEKFVISAMYGLDKDQVCVKGKIQALWHRDNPSSLHVSNTICDSDPKPTFQKKLVVVWKKADKEFKIVRKEGELLLPWSHL